MPTTSGSSSTISGITKLLAAVRVIFLLKLSVKQLYNLTAMTDIVFLFVYKMLQNGSACVTIMIQHFILKNRLNKCKKYNIKTQAPTNKTATKKNCCNIQCLQVAQVLDLQLLLLILPIQQVAHVVSELQTA